MQREACRTLALSWPRGQGRGAARRGSRGSRLQTLAWAVLLAACGGDRHEPERGTPAAAMEPAAVARWYAPADVAAGRAVFAAHCATCHGDNAEGSAGDWRRRRADGSLPPPPLNGSAHAWHHPLPVLVQVVRDGGVALGGTMPPFAATLSEREIISAIAWFQDFWDDETYRKWLRMGGTG